jgi:S1-C subfamily serine protease
VTLRDLVILDEPVGSTLGAAVMDRRGGIIGFALPAPRDGAGQADTVVVPIDLALVVAQDLIDNGTARTGSLGVSLADVDPATAATMAVAGGAMVAAVTPQAAAQGLMPGDAIVAIDGEAVPNAAWLSLVVRRLQPAQQVTLTTVRSGERSVFRLSLVDG